MLPFDLRTRVKLKPAVALFESATCATGVASGRTLPATTPETALADVRSALSACCDVIRARLHAIVAAADEAAAAPAGAAAAASAIQFGVVALEDGLSEAVMHAPGETHTIGELLRRAIYDTAPDIAFAAYSVSAHERRLTLTVRSASDPATIITKAAQMAIDTFDEIHHGLT